MTDDYMDAPHGSRPIEQRVGGPLDAGFAFDAHTAVSKIINRKNYKDTDELEEQIINEVLAPARNKIEGYRTEEDDEVLLVFYNDSTVLRLQYLTTPAGPAIDVRSGWKRTFKQVN